MAELPHTAEALVGRTVRVKSLGSQNRYRVLVDRVTIEDNGWILLHGELPYGRKRRFLTALEPDYPIFAAD